MGKHGQVRDFTFNYRFLISLAKVSPLFYPGLEWSAIFTLLTLLLAIAQEFANYYSGLNIGNFTSSLVARDEAKFWSAFWYSTGLYAAQCLALSLTSFFSWCLHLTFRRNAIRKMQDLYFNNGVFYKMNCVDDGGVDNPDQRMTQDLDRASEILATRIIPVSILAPILIGYYTWETIAKAGLWGAGFIYLYFIIGTLANRLFLSPIAKWSARVEKAEGDFRYKHVSIRSHSEEISFYRAAFFENNESLRLFDEVYEKMKRRMLWKLPGQWFQFFFNYFGGVVSYAIIVFPVFVFHWYDDAKPDEISKIVSNDSFVFMYLVNSFTRLTDLAMQVGEFAGYIQRISEFKDHATSLSDDFTGIAYGSDISLYGPGQGRGYDNQATEAAQGDSLIEVSGLSYSTPSDDRVLVQDLSFSIPMDESLLITGPSGVGKSSLLRCLAKMWPSRTGSVSLFALPRGIIFLPQRPYFPVGRRSLKQQVVYPVRADDVAPEENGRILDILSSLGLAQFVADDLGREVDFEWQDQLSPGEQQRLSFARVLFHRPSLVVLDEATSSLSEPAEEQCYKMLKMSGINYISTGHRSTLRIFHDRILNIDEAGRYSIYVSKKGL